MSSTIRVRMDPLLQRAIRTCTTNSTLVVIAHRLSTIIDFVGEIASRLRMPQGLELRNHAHRLADGSGPMIEREQGEVQAC